MRNKTPRILCDGNSLSTPYGGQISYSTQLKALVGRTPVIDGIATSGITTEALVDRYPTTIAKYARPQVLDTIIVWETRNSMYYSTTVRNAVNATWQYVELAKASGWNRIFVGTIIATANGGDLTEAKILEANSLLKSECTLHGAKIIDFAADTRLSNYTNPIYYLGDHVHLTTAGYGVIAQLSASEIYIS